MKEMKKSMQRIDRVIELEDSPVSNMHQRDVPAVIHSAKNKRAQDSDIRLPRESDA